MSRRIPIALTGAVVLAAAVIAAPGTAAPTGGGKTVITYTGDPTSGSQLSVAAAPGQANSISIDLADQEGGDVYIRDKAGIGLIELIDVPCARMGPTLVRCDATGLDRLDVTTGDRADVVDFNMDGFPPFDLAVDLGTGDNSARLGFKPADVIVGTIGQVVVRSEDGEDSVRLGFKPADVIVGTIGQILVDTGAGADALSVDWLGFKPADIVVITMGQIVAALGAGPDRLAMSGPGTGHGGPGNDTLLGGFGPQHLFGEDGDDLLAGGDGEGDQCDGGEGFDTVGPGCETVTAIETQP